MKGYIDRLNAWTEKWSPLITATWVVMWILIAIVVAIVLVVR